MIAHRGAWLLSGEQNSLGAFEAAIEVGADMIELDVRRTRDGALIVHHDAELDGVPLRALSRRELNRMAGPRDGPPTLEEVVEVIGGRIALDVELKEPGYVAEVLALVAPLGIRCLLSSFIDRVVQECKRQAPEIDAGLIVAQPCGPPTDDGVRRRCLQQVERRLDACRADYVVLQAGLLGGGVADLVRAARVRALVWTVNEVETLGRLIVDPTFAGVITDRPALALTQRRVLCRRADPLVPS